MSEPEPGADEIQELSRKNLGRLMLKAMRELDVAYARKFDATGREGLRLSHLSVFAFVSPEGVRISELAEKAGTTRQAMSQLVRDLEAGGYLRVEPDPTDGRASIVRVTERGRVSCKHTATLGREVEDELAEEIGRERLDALKDALSALIVELGHKRRPLSPVP